MKTVLLAGVSSKIGQALASQLLSEGLAVILVNRRSNAYDKATRHLRSLNGEQVIAQYTCDFSDLADIDRLVSTLKTQHPAIDAIYYNVGIINLEKKTQSQGFEEQIMVNALAPWYLLTNLNHLRNSPLQVTCSGSAASQMVKQLDIKELLLQRNYHGFKTAYAPSKAALKVLMHSLQADHPNWNVSVVDLWPTKTNMVTNPALPWLMRKLAFAFKSPQASALRLKNASKEINLPKPLRNQEAELITEVKNAFREPTEIGRVAVTPLT